jgi:general secretion pathway protein G
MREQNLVTWLQKRPARQRARHGVPSWRAAGFTLIELMIVIAIILILLGMAATSYTKSVRRAREAVLKSDLQELRKAIDNYTLDKEAPPQSVSDLFDQKYLHAVPIDPMTQQADWVPQFDSVVLSPDQNGTGMTDVHSNSDQLSLEGTPYNTW